MFTLVVIFTVITEFKFVSKLHFFSAQRLEHRHLVKPVQADEKHQ